jgi:hypothetical protein
MNYIAMMKDMRTQKGEQQRRYKAKQTTKTNKQT